MGAFKRKVFFFMAVVLFPLSKASAEVYWEPYKFKGTEFFKYEIKQKKGNTVEKGIYMISLKKEGSKIKLHIKGKMGDNEGSLTTTVSSASDVPGVIMAQSLFNPWIGPLGATVLGGAFLSAFSMAIVGSSWEVGSGWTRTEGGKKVSFKVESECSYAGKKGRRLVQRENGKVVTAICVAKGVALPLYMKNVKQNGDFYEATLVEYREK